MLLLYCASVLSDSRASSETSDIITMMDLALILKEEVYTFRNVNYVGYIGNDGADLNPLTPYFMHHIAPRRMKVNPKHNPIICNRLSKYSCTIRSRLRVE